MSISLKLHKAALTRPGETDEASRSEQHRPFRLVDGLTLAMAGLGPLKVVSKALEDTDCSFPCLTPTKYQLDGQ